MNKKLAWITMFIFLLGLVLSSCITTQKPTASNFKAPVIALESFMVPQYDGYYYYGAKIKPTKGDAGDHGSPLPMSFLFNIKNPNPYPIELQEFKFTVNFDKEFDVVTVNVQDSTWVPANGMTSVRATTLITTRSALLSLLVTGGYVLKEKGWSPWDALERWWKGVPEVSVPVAVKDASFTFDAGGVLKVLPFKADVS